MAISGDFTAYLETVDLSLKFHPTRSLSTLLSSDHLIKLLRAAHQLQGTAPLQADKGRLIACEFKHCLWTSTFDSQTWLLFPEHVLRDVRMHVRAHLTALLGAPVLWKDVPLAQSSDGLDMFPCFWKCWAMDRAPQGAQLLEHLVRAHYPPHAMYSCPLCGVHLALEAGEETPGHVRVNMVLVSGEKSLGPDAAQAVDHPDIQAQTILLEHYKEDCPKFSPRKSPLWNDLPDHLKQRLDGQLKALSA